MEQDSALLLANPNEERKAKVLQAFGNLERRNELINEQKDVPKQDIDAFKTELISVSVGSRVARASTWFTPYGALDHLPPSSFQNLGQVRGRRTPWLCYTKVCAGINTKPFGMLYEDIITWDPRMTAQLMLFDVDLTRWHRFSHYTQIDEFIETMCIGDRGLVCIVSTYGDKRELNLLCIVVFNALTRQERELPHPPRPVSLIQPIMVQLVMDRDSKFYKVIVVGVEEGW